MIIVVFGISGVGKTFLCEAISQRLHFKKFNKIKIRKRRPDEQRHKDVIISDEKFLNTLREEGKIALEFKLFDNTYAFLKEDFNNAWEEIPTTSEPPIEDEEVAKIKGKKEVYPFDII